MTIFTKFLSLDIATALFAVLLAWINWTDPQIIAAVIAAIPTTINLTIRAYQAIKKRREKREQENGTAQNV